ncbi:MAG: hypothetical protein K6T90_05545 [Leptolyngbyaceae cyanobacterium HOT.MB2.61]|jgi:hypothetical protein|nr:hypothetical protein [Leptolyngbyaceae cyanobacterium HOT.MB2.61]
MKSGNRESEAEGILDSGSWLLTAIFKPALKDFTLPKTWLIDRKIALPEKYSDLDYLT